MLNILTTILPIFAVIFLGWGLRRLDLMPDGFQKPANRLVYFVAIPAMVFREIAEAAFAEHFSLLLAIATLSPLLFVFLGGLLLVGRVKMHPQGKGTFLQCSFHGNLGYIGLAVAYYFLGDEGLTRASILAGFVMLLQNSLAVAALSRFATQRREESSAMSALGSMLRRILLNPIIISAGAGIAVSLSGAGLPLILDRSLKILAGMALPLALLVIGTSLSFNEMRQQLSSTLTIGFLKLMLLPALGLSLFYLLELSRVDYLPALILLASPTATVSYVMASEMAGDSNLAAAAISLTTLASALTFTLWLGLVS